MSLETQLKERYAEAHHRLINGNESKQDIVATFPTATISAKHPPKQNLPEIRPLDLSPVIKPRYSLAMLAEWLSGMELVGVADIRSRQRTKEIALPRMIFYHLAYKHSSARFSSMQIGLYCRKDHTSVLSGIKTIAEKRKTDKQLNFRLKQYEEALISQNIEVKGRTLCALCPHRNPQPST